MPTLSTKVNASLTILHLLQYFQTSVCLLRGGDTYLHLRRTHLQLWKYSPPVYLSFGAPYWSPNSRTYFPEMGALTCIWDGQSFPRLMMLLSSQTGAMFHMYIQNIHSNFWRDCKQKNIAYWLDTVIVFFRMYIFDDSSTNKECKLNHNWDITYYIFTHMSVVTHAATLISPI